MLAHASEELNEVGITTTLPISGKSPAKPAITSSGIERMVATQSSTKICLKKFFIYLYILENSRHHNCQRMGERTTDVVIQL